MPDSASNPRMCGRPRGSLSSLCLTREISNNNQMRGQLKGQGQLKEQTKSEFHGETMGFCENTGITKRARWSHEMKVFLIGLLHDYDVPGYRTQNAWSPDAWTKITAGVNEKFGVSFTNLQVKQKEQDLKKDYRSVKDLLEESGFGWDSDRNMVDAPDNVWASFLARRNNKDALKWRDRSFSYYDELSPLYEGRYAEGRTRQGMDHYASKANHESVPKHGTNLSRSPSPTMPDPSQSDIPDEELEQGNLDHAPHLTTPRQHVQVAPSSTHISLEKGDTKRGKRKKKDIDDGFHERYLKLKKEEIDRFAAIEEKKLEDPYNINKCITAIEGLKELQLGDMMQASDIFKSCYSFIFLKIDCSRFEDTYSSRVLSIMGIFHPKTKLKWLNQELVKIWPFVNEAASELIKTSVEPVFEQYKSFILASIHFSKLTLGTVAPQFTGVQLLDSDSAGITMELEMQWDGNPNIVLDIQTTLGISLPVQVKNIGFTGVLRLLFKPLVAELPCFGAVCVSLREKSKVDFTLKVVGGEMTAIPGISDAIEGTIRDTIEDTLTWPNRIIVPIVPGDYSDLELKPVGLLEVKLVEARDLKNKDLVGKSDPFAMLYIRPLSAKTKKSKTINNDLNPIWNEHYEFVVEDSSTQHLTVKIYDDEGLQPSEIIGCARVELAGLQPGKVKDVWLELVKDLEIQRDKKPRGQVHLELLYYPFAKQEGVSNPFASQIQLTSLEKVLKTESNGFDVNQRKNVIVRGVLSVTVISAEDIPAMDVMGKADPFVVLYLKKGETKKKTRVVTETLNPIWNQTFDFVVEDALHDLLMVEVWDHDTFGKDYVGRCILTLTRAILEGEFQDTYVLQGAKSGKLSLHFKWTPQPIYRDRDRDQ